MKLSVIEKARISRKEGVKLTEEKLSLDSLGVSLYLCMNSFVWIVEKTEGEIKLTKLSEKWSKMVNFSVNDGKYFLGTEGLFFKQSTKSKSVQKIYDEKINGARVMSSNILALFQETKDVILQLSPNSGRIEKLVPCCQIVFLGRPVISKNQTQVFGASKDRRLILKEGKVYYCYTIGIQKKGLYREREFSEAAIKRLLEEKK